jgi:hypothetical protein
MAWPLVASTTSPATAENLAEDFVGMGDVSVVVGGCEERLVIGVVRRIAEDDRLELVS